MEMQKEKLEQIRRVKEAKIARADEVNTLSSLVTSCFPLLYPPAVHSLPLTLPGTETKGGPEEGEEEATVT